MLPEVLSSMEFLGIFIPALIGVIGSFALYIKRRKDRITKLRLAFRAELSSMKPLETWPEEPDDEALPGHDFTINHVYRANVNEIGLLSVDEINSIVVFYSLADIVESHIDLARDAHAADQEVDFDSLHKSLNWLDYHRRNALSKINERIGDEFEDPKIGDTGWG